jgi:Cu/Ag efflux protein CusF
VRPLPSRRRLLASLLAVAACAPLLALAAPTQYSTRGVVKGFGPKRAYVSVAHEKIPGYMEAMTMSFEPRRPEQLDGIDVGASVKLTFTATDDGHRMIDAITKL